MGAILLDNFLSASKEVQLEMKRQRQEARERRQRQKQEDQGTESQQIVEAQRHQKPEYATGAFYRSLASRLDEMDTAHERRLVSLHYQTRSDEAELVPAHAVSAGAQARQDRES